MTKLMEWLLLLFIYVTFYGAVLGDSLPIKFTSQTKFYVLVVSVDGYF